MILSLITADNYNAAEILPAVESMLRQLTSDSESTITDNYLRELVSLPNVHLLIARDDDNRIVGMVTIGEYPTPSGRKVWIEDVVVDQSQRGKGYGKELIHNALTYIRDVMEASSVALTSNPKRIAANALYRSVGFEQYHTNVYKIKLK